MPDRDIDSELLRRVFHTGAWGFSLVAFAMGCAVLLQDGSRMQTPGWRVAMAYGGPVFWGAWLMFGGLLMLLAMVLQRRGKPVMLVGSIMVAFALWGRAAAAVIAASTSTGSWTGPLAWVSLAAVYLAQGLLHAYIFRQSGR